MEEHLEVIFLSSSESRRNGSRRSWLREDRESPIVFLEFFEFARTGGQRKGEEAKERERKGEPCAAAVQFQTLRCPLGNEATK